MKNSQLPEGFALDDGKSSSQLPDGFVLEEPAKAPERSVADRIASAVPDFLQSAVLGTGKVGAGAVQRASEFGGDATAGFYRKVLSAIRPDLAEELGQINQNDVAQSAGNAGKALDQIAPSTTGRVVGELAPYAGLGAGRLAGGLKGVAQGAGYGLAGGGASGYLTPTDGKDTDETSSKAIDNAVTGGLAGLVLGGGVKAASDAVPAIFGSAKDFYKGLTAAPEEKAVSFVKKAIQKEGFDPAVVADRIQNASDTGVPLTLPEALDNVKLMSAQKQIASSDTPGSKVMRDFNRQRFEGDLPRAVQDFIKSISPNTSLDSAGQVASEAAQGAVNAASKARQAKAAPLYQEAFQNNLPAEQLNNLLTDPMVANAVKSVSKDPAYQKELAGLTPDNFKFLQRVKEVLDDQRSTLMRSGEGNKARLYGESVDNLLSVMDAQSPAYQQARSAYSTDTKGIDKLKQDTLGNLTDLNIGNYEKAIPKIFSDTPEGIARSRTTISTQNPQAWQDLLASQVQSNLDKIRDGGFKSLYNNLYGNEVVRNRYQAAMSPEQYDGFSKLMEGINDAMKVTKGGSDTLPNMYARSAMENDLGSPIASAARNWYNIPGKIADHFNANAIEKNSEALARLFTSPRLGDLAEQLRDVKPGTPEYYQKIGDFITLETAPLTSTAITQ